MVVPNTPKLLETTNSHLTQSADSLDSALAQFGKLAASFEHHSISAVPALPSAGKGFDEWLATDLQLGALLAGGEETPLASTSPFSIQEESPLLEYEALQSGAAPSLFELTESLLGIPSASPQSSVKYQTTTSPLGLTTTRLQQAAAALNIPWSQELERAVFEQSKKLPAVYSPSLGDSASLQHGAVNTATTAITTMNAKRSRVPEETESDELLAKRAKNTDAARRSRLKKLVKLEGLEVKVTDLENTNHRLNTRVAVLETEKNGFLIKEAEQNARIAQLEAKIMEAHLAIKTRGL